MVDNLAVADDTILITQQTKLEEDQRDYALLTSLHNRNGSMDTRCPVPTTFSSADRDLYPGDGHSVENGRTVFHNNHSCHVMLKI